MEKFKNITYFFDHLCMKKRTNLITFTALTFLMVSILFTLTMSYFYYQDHDKKSRSYRVIDHLSTEADTMVRYIAQNVTYGIPTNDEMMAYLIAFRKDITDFQTNIVLAKKYDYQTRLDQLVYLGTELIYKLENIFSEQNMINDLVKEIDDASKYYQNNVTINSESMKALVLYNKLLYLLVMTFNHEDNEASKDITVHDFSTYLSELNQLALKLSDSLHKEKIMRLIPKISPIVHRYWIKHKELDDVIFHPFYQEAERLEEDMNKSTFQALKMIIFYVSVSFSLFILMISYVGYSYVKYQRERAISDQNQNDLDLELLSQEAYLKDSFFLMQFEYIDLEYIKRTMDEDPVIIDLALGVFVDEHQYDSGLLQRYSIEDKKIEATALLKGLTTASNSIGALPLAALSSKLIDASKYTQPLTKEDISMVREYLKKTIDEAQSYQKYLRVSA